MAQVVWTDAGLASLQELIAFIAGHSVPAAEKLNARLLTAPELLETNPRMGRRVPEFNLDHLRELIVPPYRILYVFREDTCFIVAVIHSSRDLINLIQPEDLESN